VTVAHELIHLADRVRGQPRRHRCHGYDSISVDEAAVTGYPPEDLRALLREETTRREKAARAVRPIRYIYVCPRCGKEYQRVRRYPRAVSCGTCDHAFNPAYALVLKETLDAQRERT
jgi:predicted SprT family Zn-dependent metalloprotease